MDFQLIFLGSSYCKKYTKLFWSKMTKIEKKANLLSKFSKIFFSEPIQNVSIRIENKNLKDKFTIEIFSGIWHSSWQFRKYGRLENFWSKFFSGWNRFQMIQNMFEKKNSRRSIFCKDFFNKFFDPKRLKTIYFLPFLALN